MRFQRGLLSGGVAFLVATVRCQLKIRHGIFEAGDSAKHSGDLSRWLVVLFPAAHGFEAARAGFMFRFWILVAASDAVAGSLPPCQHASEEVLRFGRIGRTTGWSATRLRVACERLERAVVIDFSLNFTWKFKHNEGGLSTFISLPEIDFGVNYRSPAEISGINKNTP